MSPNEIQMKHRLEREAVLDDALRHSLQHLRRADNHFGAAIGDKQLRTEFAAGIRRALDILQDLGIEDAAADVATSS